MSTYDDYFGLLTTYDEYEEEDEDEFDWNGYGY